ncbi:hypothetical protein AMQ83_13680, partial [Paenibacillus riograndensis]
MYGQENLKAAQGLAEKSSVLRKNYGVLALQAGQRVAWIGPFAASGDILGWWSWQGSQETAVQLGESMQKVSGDPGHVVISEGCSIDTITEAGLAEAVKAAAAAEIIVLALGESSEMSGEGGSRSDIRLPEAQLKLVREMKKLGKPVVAGLFNGRPLDLHDAVSYTPVRAHEATECLGCRLRVARTKGT